MGRAVDPETRRRPTTQGEVEEIVIGVEFFGDRPQLLGQNLQPRPVRFANVDDDVRSLRCSDLRCPDRIGEPSRSHQGCDLLAVFGHGAMPRS